jgi:hypothetical protein
MKIHAIQTGTVALTAACARASALGALLNTSLEGRGGLAKPARWRSGVAPARVIPLMGWSVDRFGSTSMWMLSLALFVAPRTHLWLICRS